MDKTKLPKTKGSMSCPKGLGIRDFFVEKPQGSSRTHWNWKKINKGHQKSSKQKNKSFERLNMWKIIKTKKTFKVCIWSTVTVLPNCLYCCMFLHNTGPWRSLKAPPFFTWTIPGICLCPPSHQKMGCPTSSYPSPRDMKISGCPTTAGCKTGLFPTAT